MIQNMIWLLGAVWTALLLGLLLPLQKERLSKWVLTTSGAYLLAIAVLELFPLVYSGITDHDALHKLGLWVLAGYMLQLLLELFSGGVEHGHRHIGSLQPKRIPWVLLIALFLHAFLEGLPVGAMGEDPSARKLTLAIAFHSFPITLVLFSMLRSLDLSTSFSSIVILLFGCMPVSGILLADQMAFLQSAERELTALALGVFLHVSTTIIFESAKGHSFNLAKFISILLAFALAFLAHELI